MSSRCQPGSSRRRRALEHDEFSRVLCELGDHLQARGARADDAHALAAKLFEVRAGVVVIPAARVEGVSRESVDAADAGELRLSEGAGRSNHIPCAEYIASIGLDEPLGIVLLPCERGGAGLEEGVVVQPVMIGDAHGMLTDLLTRRVSLCRHIAGLLEQGHVDVRLDVASDARVAVPVPGAADVARLVHQAHVVDARLAQERTGLQAAEAGADDEHRDAVRHGLALDSLRVRILRVVPEFARSPGVLAGPVGADPPIAFAAVDRADRVEIDVCFVGHELPFR
jgi:hypothetical protein